MKLHLMEQVETDVNSPDKLPTDSTAKCHHSKHHIINAQSAFSTSNHQSKTQKEIHSHSIIREVLKANQHKSIRHHINSIDEETVLYAKPQPHVRDLQFQSIPPKNKLYTSVYLAKIQHISKAFSEKKNVRLQPKENHGAGSQARTKSKITVSGLVTYKFNSVNAERSLGFDRLNHDQNMKNEIERLKSYRECSRLREKSILAKGAKRKYDRYLETEQAIMGNFHISTDEYLSQLMKERAQGTLIYNERASKLKHVKDLMQEGIEIQDARHLVERIEEMHAPELQKKPSPSPFQLNEEQQMQRRRVSSKQRRVFLRYQTFVD